MSFDVVKDGGADPTGAKDSTPAWRAAVAVAAQADIEAPRGRYSIRDVVAFEHLHGVKVEGQGTTGETYGAQLAWDGAAGGTVMLLNGSRDCSFEDLAIVPGANPFAIGVDIDELTPVSSITTNQWLRRITVRNPTVAGFRFGKNAPNNTDLFTLEGCQVIAWGLHQADGIQIWNAQSKAHRIIGGSLAGCANGVHTPGGGSFEAFGLNYSDNLIDNFLEWPTDFIAWHGVQSESAGRFLKTPYSGTAWPVAIFGGRLALNKLASDGKYIDFGQRGTLRLDTVNFETSGSNPESFSIAAANVVADACSFPNKHPFTGTATARGCMYVDPTGHGFPMAV